MPPEDADSWFVGDKIVVIPALEEQDTSWVAEGLSDWQRAIYIVNPTDEDADDSSILKTPINKGHEAMAYLTYIIDNYNSSIPSIVAFLHAHQNGFFEAWHVDTPLHDNVVAMRSLQLKYVKKKGFVNLRCNWNPGCTKIGRSNSHITKEIWYDIFDHTSTPIYNSGTNGSAALPAFSKVEDREKDLYMGAMNIWTTCCAQFAVSREQIYKRPLEDYVRIRQWIIDTEQTDAQSGRVMEFLWHVIFGKPGVFCPDQDICYCDVYGRC